MSGFEERAILRNLLNYNGGQFTGTGEDNIIPVNSCRNFLVDRVAGFKRPSALSLSLSLER